MGSNRSRHLRRVDSLPTMQLFEYRVPADDAEIFDARTGRLAMRAENYSEGILLSGLPLYLDKPGRAFNRTPLASVLSWWGDQLGPGEKRVAEAENPVRDAENAQRSTLNSQQSMDCF